MSDDHQRFDQILDVEHSVGLRGSLEKRLEVLVLVDGGATAPRHRTLEFWARVGLQPIPRFAEIYLVSEAVEAHVNILGGRPLVAAQSHAELVFPAGRARHKHRAAYCRFHVPSIALRTPRGRLTEKTPGLVASLRRPTWAAGLTIGAVPTKRGERPLRELVCPSCGVSFFSHLVNRVYCSTACSTLLLFARHGTCICGAKAALPPDSFSWGGSLGRDDPFVAQHARCRLAEVTNFRSTACQCVRCLKKRGEYVKRKPSEGDRTLPRRQPIPSEVRAQVSARDGSICRICDLPMRSDLGQHSDWAPEIDHIKPVFGQDGGNELDNLRLVHRWCNLARGMFGSVDDLTVAYEARSHFSALDRVDAQD